MVANFHNLFTTVTTWFLTFYYKMGYFINATFMKAIK